MFPRRHHLGTSIILNRRMIFISLLVRVATCLEANELGSPYSQQRSNANEVPDDQAGGNMHHFVENMT